MASTSVSVFHSGEIPYQIIQKKSKSTLPLSEFLLLWTLVRYIIERNPKFQVLGSSGALLFRLFRIRPSGQKMTAAMQKWGLPCVDWFQFLREVFKQWKLNLESFRRWEIQKSYLESQGRWSSSTFLMNEVPWQDLEGPF